MLCQKCLCGRTGDVLGAPCQTPGCDGIIEETPPFSSLVDELPEPMTCGRRKDVYAGRIPVHPTQFEEQGADRWQRFKSNGNRVCSFCGSLHPDDFFAIVKLAAAASLDAPFESTPEIEPSDKKYKVYVNQPGVRNASEGGIKFYMQHLPRNDDGSIAVTEEQQAEYSKAVQVSAVRFERHLAARYPRSAFVS